MFGAAKCLVPPSDYYCFLSSTVLMYRLILLHYNYELLFVKAQIKTDPCPSFSLSSHLEDERNQ